jgi:peroxiredoxin
MRWLFTTTLVLALTALNVVAENKLIGSQAPEWNVTNWFNSPPLTLQELEGKVVLIRWWTAPQCPYCKATAPALNEFDEEFSKRGLQVIGIYHHKGDSPLKIEAVKKQAGKYGFKFPIAIDSDWRTLKKWWLQGDERKFTSVSFLLDRRGIIRHIHPGGQYVRGDKAYVELKKKIEELLVEPGN